MGQSPPDDRLQVLRDYAAGRFGTREAIDRTGLDDFGDLLVAMARNGLDLPLPGPRPSETITSLAPRHFYSRCFDVVFSAKQ